MKRLLGLAIIVLLGSSCDLPCEINIGEDCKDTCPVEIGTNVRVFNSCKYEGGGEIIGYSEQRATNGWCFYSIKMTNGDTLNRFEVYPIYPQ